MDWAAGGIIEEIGIAEISLGDRKMTGGERPNPL